MTKKHASLIHVENFFDKSSFVSPRRQFTFSMDQEAIKADINDRIDTVRWKVAEAKSGKIVASSRKRTFHTRLLPGRYYVSLCVRPKSKQLWNGMHSAYYTRTVVSAPTPKEVNETDEARKEILRLGTRRATRAKLAEFAKDVERVEGVLITLVLKRGADSYGAIKNRYSEIYKRPLKNSRSSRIKHLWARLAELVDLSKLDLHIWKITDGELSQIGQAPRDQSIRVVDIQV